MSSAPACRRSGGTGRRCGGALFVICGGSGEKRTHKSLPKIGRLLWEKRKTEARPQRRRSVLTLYKDSRVGRKHRSSGAPEGGGLPPFRQDSAQIFFLRDALIFATMSATGASRSSVRKCMKAS